MRFTGRPRCKYAVTDRKRAATVRWQQRQRDVLPLLAPLIAEAQPCIDAVMDERAARWDRTEREWRDRRAGQWREAIAQRSVPKGGIAEGRSRGRRLDAHAPPVRRALLAYWNGHRWLPGDPAYLLDMLHGFETGRLIFEDGQVRPAVAAIPVARATAAFGPAKPVSRGWFGLTATGSCSDPPEARPAERAHGAGRKPRS